MFSIFYAVTVYVNSSIFPKKLIKHLTLAQFVILTKDRHCEIQWRLSRGRSSSFCTKISLGFDVKQWTLHVRSTIRENREANVRSFRNRNEETMARWLRCSLRSRVPAWPWYAYESRPVDIAPTRTADNIFNYRHLDEEGSLTRPTTTPCRDRTLTSRFDDKSNRDLMMVDNVCARLVAYLWILNDSKAGR